MRKPRCSWLRLRRAQPCQGLLPAAERVCPARRYSLTPLRAGVVIHDHVSPVARSMYANVCLICSCVHVLFQFV